MTRPLSFTRGGRTLAALSPFTALVGSLVLILAPAAQASRPRPPSHEAKGRQTFASPQVDPLALTSDGLLLFVAATTSNRVDVINTSTQSVVATVEVGLDPVSVAVNPDDSEAWVSNHVSDSVSVIDIDPGSPTFLTVVETVQDLDANGVSQFDEPVGIAFKEDGSQAYVALSSRNDIAVVDTSTYQVTSRLHVTAQDPRAIRVKNGRLYVTAFESGNQSELSACGAGSGITDQCSMWAVNFDTLNSDLLAFATNPNMPGNSKSIVIDPQAPDRDLFVYDTSTLGLVDTVTNVGTLLYGVAVSDGDQVYVTQTEARNAANGNDSGAPSPSDVNGDGDVNLADLENRIFLNQITAVSCSGASCGSPQRHDLEPAPGATVSLPLATPYGVAVSAGANPLLVATAAASSRIFTWDPSSGTGPTKVLDSLDVGAIPRGVALDSAAGRAYVLNTLDNSVSVVDVDVSTGPNRGQMAWVADIAVGADPTPDPVRLGRIAFNTADASTSGTFACASCHPDGNTDQLVWRIGGECQLGGCVPDEDEPRTTMPVRGLRDSVPLHWTGNLGDPFGGPNGDVGSGGNLSATPGCSVANQHGCFAHLVDEALAGVMCDQPTGCPSGGNELSAQERDDMASFLEVVSYPPARSRRMDDSVSRQSEGAVQVGAITVGAVEGFEDFFFDQGQGSLGVTQPDTCADSDAGCHELPLGSATNSETLQAFDAPTMRGMTDRFVQFSPGITAPEEILAFANPGLNIPAFNLVVDPIEAPIQWDPNEGMEEVTTFAAAFLIFQPTYGVRPLDIFQMFEEASTGHSGALGRQVTLNPATAAGAPASQADALLDELEAADDRKVVNLRGSGLRNGAPVTISYDPVNNPVQPYKVGAVTRTRAQLLTEAQNGTLVATLTAHLRAFTSENTPQPLIAPVGAQCGAGSGVSGDPAIPTGTTITIEASHVDEDDVVFLNGQPTAATITLLGTPDVCDTQGGPSADAPDEITPTRIQVSGIPRTGGTDLLQIRSTLGLLSNELPLP